MKKFRFLSAITLASVIVSGTAFAATGTTMKGEYKAGELKNVKDSTVVAFQLSDPNDTVKVDEIKDLGGYISVNANGKTEVTTGDVITTNGTSEQKHVVVYGDVNGDKQIDLTDAIWASNMITEMPNPNQTELNVEAADVKNTGEIQLDDIIAVSEFITENDLDYVKDVPEPSHTPEKSGYIVEGLVNANKEAVKCVNSENLTISDGDLKLKVSTPSAEEERTVHVFVKVPQEDGTEKKVRLSANGGVTIADHQTQHFIDLIGNDSSSDRNNESGLDELPGEGTFTVVITDDATGEELAATTIEIHTAKPVARDYTTNRSGSKTATMTLTGVRKEGGKVVEVNYHYKDLPSGSYPAEYTTLDLVNNKLENRQIASDLKDNPATAYDVEFYVVDEYGNKSDNYTTTIVKDTGVGAEDAVEDITVPELNSSLEDGGAKYTWNITGHTDNTYLVTLYKDGEVIDQKASEKASTEASFDLKSYIEEYGEGEYYISVVVKGNAEGTSKDSEATTTEEELVTITKMNSVANVKFETTEEGTIITWDYPTLAEDVKDKYSFDVLIEEWDPAGNAGKGGYRTSNLTATNPAQDEDGNNLQNARKVSNSLTPNTLYKATVTVKPTSDYHYLQSDPVSTAKDYFTLDANAIDSVATTTNTATITVDDTQLHFGNKENVTYGVIVYRQDDPDPDAHDATPGYRKLDPSKYTVTTNEDGKVVVSGLEADHNYKFLLTVDVDGDHGEMKYDDAESGTTKIEGISSLTNVEVKANKPEEGKSTSNVIVKTSSGADSVDGLYINGVQYEKGSNNFDKYYPNELLNKAYAVLTASNTPVVAGDKINSLTEDTVAITVADDKAQSTKDFSGTAFENMTIELTGDAYKTTVSNLVTGAKLVVKKGYVDVSALSSNDVTLETGADVLTTTNQIVNVSGTTTINKVDLTTTGKTAIKTVDTTSKFEVQVDNDNKSNNLTFNNQTGSGVVLAFRDVSNAKNAIYAGNVTITSKGDGKVQVYSADKGISGKLTLNVTGENNGAEVEINDTKLADVTKTVNLNGKISSVKVRSLKPVPVELTGVELKEYTLEDITKDTSNNTHLNTVINGENYEEVMKFISDFKLNGKGAKFTSAAKDSEDIVIGGASGPMKLTSQVTLGNIK